METKEMAGNPHILAILYPLQGHINPTIQLCKRLTSKRVRVTLIATASMAASLHKDITTCSISVQVIPDYTVAAVGPDQPDISASIQNYDASVIHGLPEIIQNHGKNGFPVKAILYDSICPWILDIAHENGVKGAVLFTQNCTVSSIYYHLRLGNLQLPEDEEEEIVLPGMVAAFRLRDLPSFVYNMSLYGAIRKLLFDQFLTFDKADWRLFNTFDNLEDKILKWFGSQHSNLTIGPTIPSMYTDKRIKDNCDYGLNISNPSPQSCIQWLDSRDDRSVIYVSFGSFASLGERQMEELAWGLVASEFYFLWVVRSPEQSKLPKDFMLDSLNKGLILTWCHQLEVLSHRAVGCFLTHCGWNSALEALSLGVPMVAMPQWSDQTTNAKLIVDVWKTGVRVKVDEEGVVGKDEIADCVKEVMLGERGGEIRCNVLKWRCLATEAVSEGGTSDENFVKFVKDLSE